jgi:hypothetical protein
MVAIGPKRFKPTVIVKLIELIKPYIPDIRWGHQVHPKISVPSLQTAELKKQSQGHVALLVKVSCSEEVLLFSAITQ